MATADEFATAAWNHNIADASGAAAPAKVWLTEARNFAVEAHRLAGQAVEQTKNVDGAPGAQWAKWSTDWATKASKAADAIQAVTDGLDAAVQAEAIKAAVIEALKDVHFEIDASEIGEAVADKLDGFRLTRPA